MNKETLEQLRYLCKEIKVIENQIQGLDYNFVQDVVKGSDINFPYVYHVIQIEGVDIGSHDEEISRLRSRLLSRREEVIRIIKEINNYIDGVEESSIRQIIILKYINGLSWKDIASYLYYADESVPRKKLERYLGR
jgi:hypothetical protein